MNLDRAIRAARDGEPAGYEQLVLLTSAQVLAVVRRIMPDGEEAHDVAQEAYLRAFHRLKELKEPSAFPAWLRRIAVTTAYNYLRDHRSHFWTCHQLDQVAVLDEEEVSWTETQRASLARVISQLNPEARLLCDRYYHGGWTIARVAAELNISTAATKKRLQRLRDWMRKEIEMTERNAIQGEQVSHEMPARVAELMARPRLTMLPDNPVGAVYREIQSHLADYEEIELPEKIDGREVRATFPTLGAAIVTSGAEAAFEIDQCTLRTDLTLPMLMAARGTSERSLLAGGKVYREMQSETASHLRAFHQLELLHVSPRMSAWNWVGDIVELMRHLLPGCKYRIEPTEFAPCDLTWSLDIQKNGQWSEILGAGHYRSEVVEALGHDPSAVSVFGAGFGLERIAMMIYDLQDIRQVEGARVDLLGGSIPRPI